MPALVAERVPDGDDAWIEPVRLDLPRTLSAEAPPARAWDCEDRAFTAKSAGA